MSGPDPALAEEEAPDDEYDELVQLIVSTEWQPGDTFRTAKGSTWQFRVTPYTKLAVGPSRLLHRPRVAIDAGDGRRLARGQGPRRAGHAGAASEIDDRGWRRCIGANEADGV